MQSCCAENFLDFLPCLETFGFEANLQLLWCSQGAQMTSSSSSPRPSRSQTQTVLGLDSPRPIRYQTYPVLDLPSFASPEPSQPQAYPALGLGLSARLLYFVAYGAGRAWPGLARPALSQFQARPGPARPRLVCVQAFLKHHIFFYCKLEASNITYPSYTKLSFTLLLTQ